MNDIRVDQAIACLCMLAYQQRLFWSSVDNLLTLQRPVFAHGSTDMFGSFLVKFWNASKICLVKFWENYEDATLNGVVWGLGEVGKCKSLSSFV